MYYKKNINLLESVSNFEGVCKEGKYFFFIFFKNNYLKKKKN